MKTKKFNNKLRLNKETVASLNDEKMEVVNGGSGLGCQIGGITKIESVRNYACAPGQVWDPKENYFGVTQFVYPKNTGYTCNCPSRREIEYTEYMNNSSIRQ